MSTSTQTISKSIVCPHCKVETGLTSIDVLNAPLIDADFHCPKCDGVVFSHLPEPKTYYQGGYQGGGCGYSSMDDY